MSTLNVPRPSVNMSPLDKQAGQSRYGPVAALTSYILFVALVPHEIVSAATLFIATTLFSIKPISRINYIHLTPAFAGILAVFATALLPTMVSYGDWLNLAKGIYQLLRPVVFLFMGIAIARTMKESEIITSIIIAAALLGAIYTYSFLIDQSLWGASRFQVRSSLGVGYAFWAPALTLAVYTLFRDSGLAVKAFLSASIILIVSAIIISNSRTYIIGSIIFFAAVIAPILTARATAPVAISFSFVALFVTTPLLEMAGIPFDYALIARLPFFGEMAPIAYFGEYEMNNMWRGFETRQAFNSASSAMDIVFGQGLSGYITLQYTFSSGDFTVSNVPVFHSGISLLMVKSGILGIAIYIAWLSFQSFSISTRAQLSTSITVRLALGAFLLSTYSMFSTSGIYNMTDIGCMISLLMGASCGVDRATSKV